MVRLSKAEKSILYGKKMEEANPHFKYFNANPSGEVCKDCVVRAIAKATGYSYELIDEQLCRRVMEAGYGKRESVWREWCNKHLCKITQKKGKRLRVKDLFEGDYANHIWVARISGHLTCIRYGVNYDLWDCSNYAITSMWRVPEE